MTTKNKEKEEREARRKPPMPRPLRTKTLREKEIADDRKHRQKGDNNDYC